MLRGLRHACTRFGDSPVGRWALVFEPALQQFLVWVTILVWTVSLALRMVLEYLLVSRGFWGMESFFVLAVCIYISEVMIWALEIVICGGEWGHQWYICIGLLRYIDIYTGCLM